MNRFYEFGVETVELLFQSVYDNAYVFHQNWMSSLVLVVFL